MCKPFEIQTTPMTTEVTKRELEKLIQEAKKEGEDASDMERELARMTKGVTKKQRLTPRFIKQRFIDFGGCQNCGNKDIKKLRLNVI